MTITALTLGVIKKTTTTKKNLYLGDYKNRHVLVMWLIEIKCNSIIRNREKVWCNIHTIDLWQSRHFDINNGCMTISVLMPAACHCEYELFAHLNSTADWNEAISASWEKISWFYTSRQASCQVFWARLRESILPSIYNWEILSSSIIYYNALFGKSPRLSLEESI